MRLFMSSGDGRMCANVMHSAQAVGAAVQQVHGDAAYEGVLGAHG